MIFIPLPPGRGYSWDITVLDMSEEQQIFRLPCGMHSKAALNNIYVILFVMPSCAILKNASSYKYRLNDDSEDDT